MTLFSKFKLAQDELEELQTCARKYFTCKMHCTMTQWLIGYVIPTCTQEIVAKYGYGLALNIAQGLRGQHRECSFVFKTCNKTEQVASCLSS